MTLLEVLGAVALLGILYTVLSGKAIEGLRSEGESRRRLEASLLADDRLAEIELALATGVSPEIGSSEEELDGFTVATEVRPFELSLPDPLEREGSSLAARRAAAQAVEAPSIFTASRAVPDAHPLRSIEVVVRWEEGLFEREVRRTTYALDAEAVESLFAALPQSQPPGAGSARRQREGRGSQREQTGQQMNELPNSEMPRSRGFGEEEP